MPRAHEVMIHEEVTTERLRQVAKWGAERDQILARGGDMGRYTHHKLAVLMEEVGESAKEVLERNPTKLRTELIQCAAVAIAFVAGLDELLQTPTVPSG